MRTASPMSAPAATAAGFKEDSSTIVRILGCVDSIQTVASREIYRNSWFSLREDDIRRPDGSDGIYAVVDKPTYALVIAQDGDRFHLVEQFRYPLGLRRWEFPQGTAPDRNISSRSNSPRVNCARRRACGRQTMTLLGQLDLAPGLSSQRGWVFLATGLTEGEHDASMRSRTCTARGSAVPRWSG